MCQPCICTLEKSNVDSLAEKERRKCPQRGSGKPQAMLGNRFRKFCIFGLCQVTTGMMLFLMTMMMMMMMTICLYNASNIHGQAMPVAPTEAVSLQNGKGTRRQRKAKKRFKHKKWFSVSNKPEIPDTSATPDLSEEVTN